MATETGANRGKSKASRRQRVQARRDEIFSVQPPTGSGSQPPPPQQQNQGVDRRAGLDPATRLINVVEFANARSEELARLHAAIKTPLSTRRAFQTLPRHLRKRTASHNSKRLPTHLRERADREIAGSVPKGPGKKPPRAHKRRPKLLRQQQIEALQSAAPPSAFCTPKPRIGDPSIEDDPTIEAAAFNAPDLPATSKPYWLPTHLWHAKRFHMATEWGYRLPQSPTLKFFRGAYRASLHLATVHDATYHTWFRFPCTPATSEALRDLLTMLLPPSCCSPFHPRYFSSSRALSTLLCHPSFDSLSPRPIAPVSFLWSSTLPQSFSSQSFSSQTSSPSSILWMIVHPVAAAETHAALQQLVESGRCNVAFSQHPAQFAFFSLRGPRAQAALRRVLVSADDGHSGGSSTAFRSFMRAHSPAAIPPQSVLALNLSQDPRYHWPPPRPLPPSFDPTFPLSHLSIPASSSPAGNNTCSSLVDDLTTATASGYRSELLEAPPAHQWPAPLEGKLNMERHLLQRPPPARVPVVLIHAESVSALGPQSVGSGWDVVVPLRWSMAFWTAFKAAGVRPIGQRERLHQDFEQGVPSFPLDYIDTRSYAADASLRKFSLLAADAARPASKKPNYVKLNSPHALLPDWDALVFSQTTTLLDDISTFSSSSSSSSSSSGLLCHYAVIRPPFFSSGELTLVQVHLHRGRAALHAALFEASAQEEAAWASQIVSHDPSKHRPVGFVTSCGEYSYSRGYGFGIACVLTSFLVAQRSLRNLTPADLVPVFLRNPTSQHCHLGQLHIVPSLF